MIRLYLIIGAVFLAILGVVNWQKVRAEKRARVAETALELAHAEIEAERENTRKANEASERYAISLEQLKAARAAIPTRVVRLCNTPSVSQAGATPGTDATGAEGLPQAPGPDNSAGPDVGGELYDLADEADQCAVQLEALQDWVRNR